MSVSIVRGYERMYMLQRGDPGLVCWWCTKNGIDYQHEYFGPLGEGISIRDYQDKKGHKAWFELKWLDVSEQ